MVKSSRPAHLNVTTRTSVKPSPSSPCLARLPDSWSSSESQSSSIIILLNCWGRPPHMMGCCKEENRDIACSTFTWSERKSTFCSNHKLTHIKHLILAPDTRTQPLESDGYTQCSLGFSSPPLSSCRAKPWPAATC